MDDSNWNPWYQKVHHHICKFCIAKQRKERYLLNKESYDRTKKAYDERTKDYFLKWKRQYRLKLKEEVLRYYGKEKLQCEGLENKDCEFHCNEQYFGVEYLLMFLSADHIKGGGFKQRKELKIGAGYHFYAWLRKNNYPEGYQVLCMNCQFIKRVKQNEMKAFC